MTKKKIKHQNKTLIPYFILQRWQGCCLFTTSCWDSHFKPGIFDIFSGFCPLNSSGKGYLGGRPGNNSISFKKINARCCIHCGLQICSVFYITGIDYEICKFQGTWNLMQSMVMISCWCEQAFCGHEDGSSAVNVPASRTHLRYSHSHCTEQKQNHSLQQVARQFAALGTPSTDLQLSQPLLAHKTFLRTRPSHTATDLAK